MKTAALSPVQNTAPTPTRATIQGMRPAFLEALEAPHFRRFWVAQFVSLVGSWMQSAALAWLVLSLYENPKQGTVQLGVLNAVQWTPSLLLSLFAGAALDRLPRAQVLLGSQITLMLVSLTLGLVVVLGLQSFALLLAIALVMGVANVFDIVARQSLIPTLVPRQHMSKAVALNSLSFNLSRILGSSVFAALSPVLGLGPMFLCNTCSFFGVIYAIAQLPRVSQDDAAHGNVLKDIQIGLRFVANTPNVRTPILLLCALSLTVVNFPVVVPSFAKYALQQNTAGYGLFGSSFGIGAALGALYQSSTRGNPSTRMVVGATLLCAGMAALSFANGLALACVLLACSGCGMILYTVAANSSVQLATPDHLRGRVMSVYTTVFAGMTPFGAVIASGLMAWFGTRHGVLALAALGALATLLLRPRQPQTKV